MAVTKRKTVRPTARKAVKKTTPRAGKKVAVKATKVKTKVKASAKKTLAPKATRVSIGSIDKPFTKTQLLGIIASNTGLQKRDVTAVFEELVPVIGAHLKKQGPGQFTLPGLVKITMNHKPATKARKGINPFTGEEIMFKAKPARNVVKVRPLKKLKAMV